MSKGAVYLKAVKKPTRWLYNAPAIILTKIKIIEINNVLTCLFGAQIQYLRTYSAVVLSKKMGSKIS